jgi:hypothetical protein
MKIAEKEEEERGKMKRPRWKKKKNTKEGPHETQILEQTIIKIGALLALGCGEAGAAIIAENIS